MSNSPVHPSPLRTRRTTPALTVGVTALVLSVILAGCGGAAVTPGASAGSASGSPSAAAGAQATAPAGAAPVLPVDTNPIDTSAAGTGLSIDSVLVENNVDPATGKTTDDHLEIALSNSTSSDMTGLELFYTISDTAAGTSENYYAALPADLTVPAGQSSVVNVDTSGAPGSVPANPYSLYYTSPDALDVKVMVAAAGIAPVSSTVTKDAGGAESAD